MSKWLLLASLPACCSGAISLCLSLLRSSYLQITQQRSKPCLKVSRSLRRVHLQASAKAIMMSFSGLRAAPVLGGRGGQRVGLVTATGARSDWPCSCASGALDRATSSFIASANRSCCEPRESGESLMRIARALLLRRAPLALFSAGALMCVNRSSPATTTCHLYHHRAPLFTARAQAPPAPRRGCRGRAPPRWRRCSRRRPPIASPVGPAGRLRVADLQWGRHTSGHAPAPPPPQAACGGERVAPAGCLV